MKRFSFKIFVLLFVFLFSTHLMISCNEERNEESQSAEESVIGYLVMRAGGADGNTTEGKMKEYSFWSSANVASTQDPSAPETVTISFNGKQYVGTYSRSMIRKPNTYVSHRYKSDEVIFEIHGETGALTNLIFLSELAQVGTLGESDCRAIADEIAKEYLELEMYEVERTDLSYHNNMVYSYTYYRSINGLKSSDRLTVTVCADGSISSFGVTMLGAFSRIPRFAINDKEIIATIEKELVAEYGEVPEYEIKGKPIAVVLDDGDFAYFYSIRVNKSIYQDGIYLAFPDVFDVIVQFVIG